MITSAKMRNDAWLFVDMSAGAGLAADTFVGTVMVRGG